MFMVQSNLPGHVEIVSHPGYRYPKGAIQWQMGFLEALEDVSLLIWKVSLKAARLG